jgi:hypothetical protein
VITFLNLKTEVMDLLPPDQIVGKSRIVLIVAARYARQLI